MDRTPLDVKEVEAYWAKDPVPRNWIRVGMDTGGTAAGARKVYQALVDARDEFKLEMDICKT
ncbi:MAG: hypothetical protein LC657_15210, partial [Desulfobacteraceae bacterium]|nr:hypothetical protein [Desulfobacteraceae bacterium]